MKKRKLTGIMLVLLAFLVLAGMGALALFYRSIDFDPSLLDKEGATVRGTVFLDRYGSELRFLPDEQGERGKWIAINDIPREVQDAFIAAEDERFYEHHGFDVLAIGRALWSNITKGRIVSGASTISQQVVRLVSVDGKAGANTENEEGIERGRERTYRDKLTEIVRSVKMERGFSKDEILEQYLNRLPMGNNLVGIASASLVYFGKAAADLSPSEAAILASLPKAPGSLNPYGPNRVRLMKRRDWVLGRMAHLGMLSPEGLRAALDALPVFRTLAFRNHAPHVIDMLTAEGASGGMVRTTLDRGLQVRVQQIVASHRERLIARKARQGAAIVIHNRTGEVLAAVGSMEYAERDGGFNNGLRASRSAGSTLKPFLYGLAIESGHSITALLEDTERKFATQRGLYTPSNYDRREYGPVTMRSALGNSLNLTAVKTLKSVGEERFYGLLVRLDLISDRSKGPEHYGLGLAIGNAEVSLERLAGAYAMLASGGRLRPLRYVMEAGPGTEARGKAVLLPQTAYIITDILSDPAARMLTFSRSRSMQFPYAMAAKTGTSTYFRDLWAVGYTPDYTVAVWVGNFDGSATDNLSGSTAAMPVLSEIMDHLYRRSMPAPFSRPRGLERIRVCGYSGMKPTPHCTHVVQELFFAGTGPAEECSFHARRADRHELAAPYAAWLFAKDRAGAAGRYRLDGFGDDLRAVFDDPWDAAADDTAGPVVRVKNLPSRATVSVNATGAEAKRFTVSSDSGSADGEASGIRIVYPLDNDRFVAALFSGPSLITLQASVSRPVPYVDWYINGVAYKRTGPPYQAAWRLEKGKYVILAVDPSNRGDRVQVSVE